MKYDLKKLNKFKEVRLSEIERGLIRSHVAFLMNNHKPQKSQSLLQQGIYHGLKIALSSLVFFVFVGGTVSAVADNALPGDPLYAFKLNVNEEIRALFQNTTEEKVAYDAKRVETRVKEIKTLAESKSLTKAKQMTVQKAIDSHIKDLSVNLNTLSTVAPNAALVVTSNLEENLKANKINIENTGKNINEAKEDAISTVDETIQKVSNQEIKIISKEIDSIASDLALVEPASIENADALPETSVKIDVSTPVVP